MEVAAASSPSLNDQVRAYWERQPCGTDPDVTGGHVPLSPGWFAAVEESRYRSEPFIHSIAQFSRHRGKQLLEIGVGAGTDHLQFARAGARCHGVDLTDAAIETTRARLALEGLESQLQRVDAETLPFADASFDVVYSWGVIHHSEHPEKILAEVHRVLRPGGRFIGMLYGRRSIHVLEWWVRHGVLKGRPWRTWSDVIWHHNESIGTKAYTLKEMRRLLERFQDIRLFPIHSEWETRKWRRRLVRFLPSSWGWYVGIQATR